jgi:hypothetical protein
MEEQKKDVLLSGGADGADVEFGKYAKRHGHQVIHYGFKGKNKSKKKASFFWGARFLISGVFLILRNDQQLGGQGGN